MLAGQEMDEGLEEMWLGSAQGIHAIDAGEFWPLSFGRRGKEDNR